MGEFSLRVMRLMAEHDFWDGEIWWHPFREGEEPTKVFVSCNDLFLWACADCERLTPDNIATLEQAIADCSVLEKHSEEWGCLLFCCRQRAMRPQGAYYKDMPLPLQPLFDACGGYRAATFGNPVEHA